eukprot:TRINITY_DN31081_c1_g1_i4.p2 TRINITY_DN31081_c1_g1~~TRINITY_DN31081_c1_g1_i4.p2  ORF type:complete len:245 (-),score=28.03 TRINITY_DN31081_c1_g1_i4:408-1142(-)
MVGLVVGGTGNTGKLVLEQLLERGFEVRAIVRSADRLPQQIRDNPKLTIILGSFLDFKQEDVVRHVNGCDFVICCLGHNLSFQGIFGPPYRLVTEATRMLCTAIQTIKPEAPIKFIELNTSGVKNPDGSQKRGLIEDWFIYLISVLIPPFADSVASADYIFQQIGIKDKFLEWCWVRPDYFVQGEVCEYSVYDNPVNTIFDGDQTTISNIAHFMCELLENKDKWNQWKGKMPVIMDSKKEKQQS